MLLLVVAIAVLAAGCGGGGDEAAAGGADAAAADPAASTGTGDATTGAPAAGATDPAALASGQTGDPAAAGGAAGGGDAEIVAAPGTQIETSDQTPKEFVNALGRKTIVVFMYQPTSTLDELVAKEVKAAVKRVPGVVLLTYRVGEFKKYGDLPERVALLGSSPGVAVVDREGKLQNFFRNYVDANMLTLTLRIANLAAPANVTPGDVPTESASGFDKLTGSAPASATTAGTPAATTDPAAAATGGTTTGTDGSVPATGTTTAPSTGTGDAGVPATSSAPPATG